jgi:cytochrome P450
MGSYELPKGTTIIWCPYITHRDPDVFPDPQRFKPDRWNALAPSPYEYLPFGAGAHLCIGATFAQMELKIVLAMLLQRFGLQFAPGTVVDRTYRVTLSPAGGLPMTVQPPDRKTEKIAIRGNIHQMVEL